jgi:hypothetical protein
MMAAMASTGHFSTGMMVSILPLLSAFIITIL